MPKFLELAAPVHPFLTSEHAPEDELFDDRSEDINWDYKHDLESPTSDLWSLEPLSPSNQERTRSESLNDGILLANALSPAASFLSTFLSPPPIPPSLPPDASGQTIAGYVLGQTIGYGGFSTIKEGRSPSGDIVAIKIVRHNAFDNLPSAQRTRLKSRFSHEARVWSSLSHENILPLFQSHPTVNATYLITLYCPAGSLFDILKREGTPALEQTDAGCMFRQVVKGLQYMHETMGLVHCDVKLENVLVDESGVCRLTDFGLTKPIGADCQYGEEEEEEEGEEEEVFLQQPEIAVPSVAKKPRSRSRGRAGSTTLPVHLSLLRHGVQQRHRHVTETLIVPRLQDYSFPPGSLQYASPELLLPRTSSSSRYTAHPAQDMWALGVLLYALLAGRLPFQDPFEPRLQMKIVKGTFDIPKDIGSHAETVLKGCLQKDISQRWTISMVDDAAWGIGYGAVNLASAISEEQRRQSRSGMLSPQRDQADDLSSALSSCSIGTSCNNRSPSLGGKLTDEIRSRSRSPSSPRTPIDEGVDLFSRRASHQHRETRVQFLVNSQSESWGNETRGRSDKIMAVLDGEACSKTNHSKEGLLEPKSRSQSRTRSWSFNG